MDFKQFLAVKQALALVEHMETLSEQDAQQLFDTLDEETIEFIEAVLSEISAGTLKKKGMQVASQSSKDATVANAYFGAKQAYENRPGVKLERERQKKRVDQQSNPKASRRNALGKPERRLSPSGVSPDVRESDPRRYAIADTIKNRIHDSQQARQASKYPQKG